VKPCWLTVPAVKIVAPKLASKGKPEAALLHLTDWQLGKHTSSFNMDVCRSRITQAVNACASLTDIQRSHHPVTECHVMLGGDMVEGVGIFPGQAFEVEAAAFEQLVAVAKLIESVVAALLSSFDKVHVWEEIGNHGRLGRKGDHPHGDNIDRMAYHLARTAITNPRLSWHPFGGGLGTHVKWGTTRRCWCTATRSSRSVGTHQRSGSSANATRGRQGLSHRSTTPTSATSTHR
jgi:hypothetical protein